LRTLLLTLLAFASLNAAAYSWIYESLGGKHYLLTLQEHEDNSYTLSGFVEYDKMYKWEGQLEFAPVVVDRNTVKYTVKNAILSFDNGSQVCSAPIEVILYLPRKSKRLSNFHIEAKLPVQNILSNKGLCAEPQYFWSQDPLPYWPIKNLQ